MYEQIEQILVRTLSPYEYEQIEELKKQYNDTQIIDAYKTSSVKNINYIKKYLMKYKLTPSWINKEIVNEKIDEETKKINEDFKKFLQEFRNN